MSIYRKYNTLFRSVLSIKASYLAENFGYKVHIITLNQSDAPLFYNFSNKIKHHDVCVDGNIFKYYHQYRKGIKAKIKEIEPDIISVCDDGFKGFYLFHGPPLVF